MKNKDLKYISDEVMHNKQIDLKQGNYLKKNSTVIITVFSFVLIIAIANIVYIINEQTKEAPLSHALPLTGDTGEAEYFPTATPLTDTITTIDSTGDVGRMSDIAIGSDGFPIISYNNDSTNDLKVAKCNDPACTGGDETITVLYTDPEDLWYTSIVIGDDDYPVISYHPDCSVSPVHYDLRVVKCNDIACTGGDETHTIIGPSEDGYNATMVLGNDGNPVIASFTFGSPTKLFVTKCNDPACTGGDETITEIASTNNIDLGLDMVLGDDGNPVISYYDMYSNVYDLQVVKCNDPACTGGDETISMVDGTDLDTGMWNSIDIGNDGNPVLSYWEWTNDIMKVAKCNDAACSGGDETITTVESSYYIYTKILVGGDGNPFVVYVKDDGIENLSLMKCNDPACSGGDEDMSIAATGSHYAWYPAITSRYDIPIVSSHNQDSGDLVVWYGGSWTPLLDTTIDLQYKSDEAADIQIRVDTVQLEGTSSSAGEINDVPMYETYLDTYDIYLKPEYYLSMKDNHTVEYKDNNDLTYSGEFSAGDLNNDDQVNSLDYSIFLNDFGSSGIGDFNDDGVVNSLDFAKFVKNYGSDGEYLTDTSTPWDW